MNDIDLNNLDLAEIYFDETETDNDLWTAYVLESEEEK